jgi:hypothetical protein
MGAHNPECARLYSTLTREPVTDTVSRRIACIRWRAVSTVVVLKNRW